jgi:tetratricopeptide (TPR) repeat protein
LILLLGIAGRNEEKLEWVARGLALDPLNRSFHYHRGKALITLGDIDGAEALNSVMPMGPSSIVAASIAWHRKQYEEWFAIFRDVINADPLDHEGWAIAALNLYTFGLKDEGDKYLQRAIEIAPKEALVRGAKLHQLMLLDDYSRAAELSETLLREDIDNRRGTYWFAMTAFVSAMSELDRLDEALTVLEELQPGVLSPDFRPRDISEMAFQYHAVLAFAQLQSQEETLALLDAVEPNWDESFPSWREYPAIMAQIAMARGQKTAAIELMLEDLDKELVERSNLDNPRQFQYIFSYKELTRESSIAERLSEIDSEAKNGGEEIWAYIVWDNLQL